MSSKRIRIVDSLRGIAASVVVFHHLQVVFLDAEVLERLSDPVRRIIMLVSDLNVEAVLLFFLISGFSITLSCSRYTFGQAKEWSRYLAKRLRRLLPLYWAALLLALLIGWARGVVGEAAYGLTTLIGNLLFLQSPASATGNWFVPYGQNYPLWSLSFEMCFYLLFPALTLMTIKTASALWIQRTLTDALAVLVTLTGLAVQQWQPNPIALFASHYLIWHLGLILARQHLGQRQDRLVSVLAAVAGVALITWFMARFPSATLLNLRTGLVLFLLWQMAVMINDDFAPVDWVVRGINALFLQLGLISYAIYLFHYPILHWVDTFQWSVSTSIVVALLMTVALSWLAESGSRRLFTSKAGLKQTGQQT